MDYRVPLHTTVCFIDGEVGVVAVLVGPGFNPISCKPVVAFVMEEGKKVAPAVHNSGAVPVPLPLNYDFGVHDAGVRGWSGGVVIHLENKHGRERAESKFDQLVAGFLAALPAGWSPGTMQVAILVI